VYTKRVPSRPQISLTHGKPLTARNPLIPLLSRPGPRINPGLPIPWTSFENSQFNEGPRPTKPRYSPKGGTGTNQILNPQEIRTAVFMYLWPTYIGSYLHREAGVLVITGVILDTHRWEKLRGPSDSSEISCHLYFLIYILIFSPRPDPRPAACWPIVDVMRPFIPRRRQRRSGVDYVSGLSGSSVRPSFV